MWAVLTIAAIGLNLTLGYAGQVSLAQGAFVGIGAYTVALLTQAGLCHSCWRSLLRAFCALRSGGCSVIRRCAFSIIISPSSRSRSRRWCFSCCATKNGSPTASTASTASSRPTLFRLVDGQRRMRFLFLLPRHSGGACRWRPGGCCVRPGAAPSSLCGKIQIRALSLGLDTRRYTLMAFAIGSSLGGMSGALYAPLVQFIEPNSFALGAVVQSAADGDRRRQRQFLRAICRRA